MTENKIQTPVEEKLPVFVQEKEAKLASPDVDINGKTDEDADYVPKTPSTAERRKLFENRSNSKENEEDNFDTSDNFERSSMQRSSIAERRKMYERSQSVQDSPIVPEKADGSPIMLRRKDSLKNRKNEEDGNRKNVPFPRQQSMDPQFNRKSEVAAPTPKRTSTVFGKPFYSFLYKSFSF